MPTKRRKRIIKRRGLPTADMLWQQGRYIEAVAIDPLVEFLYTDYTMSHEEIIAAAELRERWEAKARRTGRQPQGDE